MINTDSTGNPGEHWVGVFITRNFTYFFDSLGLPPLENTYEELLKISQGQVVYNRKCVQSLFTSTCGAFVVCFVYHLANGYSFESFLKLFTSNFEKNEKLVENFFKILYRKDDE